MRTAAVLLTLLVAFASAPARAQNQPDDAPIPPADPSNVLRVSSKLVVLDALVENKKTHATIAGLDRSNFELLEDGQPQQITYFGHDELPLSLVLLFDLTDTVRPSLKQLAGGAVELLAHLKPQDEVAIMVFSSRTWLVQDFTTDRGRAVAAIDRASHMTSDEGSFVHECLYEAIDEAMRARIPNSRRALVWLTDGSSNSESESSRKSIGRSAPPILHSQTEVVDLLHHTGVVVSELIETSSLTGRQAFMDRLDGAQFGVLNNYADLTGGPVLTSSKKEVAGRLADLLDQLSGRYTLGFKPAPGKPTGVFCKLSLKLTPDTFKQHKELREKDLLITTRDGYFR